MKTYMPKGRQCRILQKLTCLMCANLSGETFFKKWLFSKMAQNHAHEVDIAITINLPIVLRSDLFSEYDSC